MRLSIFALAASKSWPDLGLAQCLVRPHVDKIGCNLGFWGDINQY
jgi:hypothetical protein